MTSFSHPTSNCVEAIGLEDLCIAAAFLNRIELTRDELGFPPVRNES